MNNPDHDWKWKYIRVCRRCGCSADGEHIPPCSGGGARGLTLVYSAGKVFPSDVEPETARKLAA